MSMTSRQEKQIQDDHAEFVDYIEENLNEFIQNFRMFTRLPTKTYRIIKHNNC